MNDKSPRKFSNDADELLPEYEFDYQQAKPNRFAKGFKDAQAVKAVIEETPQGS